MRRRRESPIRVQSDGSAILLNRYLAYATHRIFNTKGSLKENVVIKEWNCYEVQWQNIKADLKSLFTNPFGVAPQIAFSLAAFIFIALGKHNTAIQVAFMGAITLGTTGGSMTTSLTTVSTLSTTSKLVILLGNHQGSGAFSGCTFDSVAATFVQAASTAFNEREEIWYLDSPGAKTNKTITASFGGGSGASIGYANLEGTASGAPSNNATANGDSSTASVSITPSSNNSIVIAGNYTEANWSAVGSGETDIFHVQGASYENHMASYNIQATATAETMDFSLGFGARWAIVAIAVAPAASSTPTIPFLSTNQPIFEPIGIVAL